MAAAARRMWQGDYRNRVAASTRDEVGQLASAFNLMAAQLEGVEASRRELVGHVSHELKTPISALQAHLANLLDGVEEPNPRVLAGVAAPRRPPAPPRGRVARPPPPPCRAGP